MDQLWSLVSLVFGKLLTVSCMFVVCGLVVV